MVSNANAVHAIVSAAGGELVGKTRLQKIAYILKAAGLIDALQFRYHYYGPYSDDLAMETAEAMFDGLVSSQERPASWGGTFTVFRTSEPCQVDEAILNVVKLACSYDSVTLELAATAAFLRDEAGEDSWEETRRRKPQKATGERLQQAQALWQQLTELDTPVRLQPI